MLHTNNTKDRIRSSMEDLHGTVQRFRAIHEAILQGTALCMKDYCFYRRQCKKNGIDPMSVTIDKDGGIPIIFDKSRTFDIKSTTRYQCLMERLDAGRGITGADYRFLKRYCKWTGAELPKLRYVLMVYKDSSNIDKH
jgi:hypothetical protein